MFLSCLIYSITEVLGWLEQITQTHSGVEAEIQAVLLQLIVFIMVI